MRSASSLRGLLYAFWRRRSRLASAWGGAHISLVARISSGGARGQRKVTWRTPPVGVPSRQRHRGVKGRWGEFPAARTHFEQAMTLYSLQPPVDRRTLHDAGVAPGALLAPVLWMLGYPEQALTSSQEALARAQALAHPESIALALDCATHVRQHRRETFATRQHAEALMVLAREHDFALRLAYGTILRGWVVAAQGQRDEGLQQLRQGQCHLTHKSATIDA